MRASLLLLGLGLLAAAPAGETPPVTERARVRVGVKDGNLRGADHRALQAAVDYVAGLGGGAVEVGPGRYALRNALTLRDNVRVIGTPGRTVLAPVEGAKLPLTSDGDANQRRVTVAGAARLRVGDRVLVGDDRNASGFAVTSAVLTGKVGLDTFLLDTPLRDDCMVSRHGWVAHAFPAVGGWGVKNAAVEHLVIEGARGKAGGADMDGCRHGGIYLFGCDRVAVRHCVVRRFRGDAISFQVSQHVRVEDCLCEGNAGHGLHPGSGSGHAVVRRNRSLRNAGDGLFVCWRVRRSRFEGNEVEGNAGDGISIGHKDSDNVFRANRVRGNGRHGILFREEAEAMGAHRNVFEGNEVLDNGARAPAGRPLPAIVIRGAHHGLVFRDNVIGSTREQVRPPAGLLVSPRARGLRQAGNRFLNVRADVRQGE
jgi:parallel beta-helix repeat protein